MGVNGQILVGPSFFFEWLVAVGHILDHALLFLEKKLDQSKGIVICLLKGPIKQVESNHKMDGPHSSNSNLKNVDLILRLQQMVAGPIMLKLQ